MRDHGTNTRRTRTKNTNIKSQRGCDKTIILLECRRAVSNESKHKTNILPRKYSLTKDSTKRY